MRPFYLALSGCMVILVVVAGLLFVYEHAGYDLALPGATAIQLGNPLSLRQQQITYRLPRGVSLSDVFVHLERNGWSRDRRAEQMLGHDQMDHTASSVFARRRLGGALSEITIVKISSTDHHQVELRIFRCLRILSQLGCL